MSHIGTPQPAALHHQHSHIRWFKPFDPDGPEDPGKTTAAECLDCGEVLRTNPVPFWGPR